MRMTTGKATTEGGKMKTADEVATEQWAAFGIAGPEHWKTQPVASMHGGFHMVQVDVAPKLTDRGTVHAYAVMYRRKDDASGPWHDDIRSAVKSTEANRLIMVCA